MAVEKPNIQLFSFQSCEGLEPLLGMLNSASPSYTFWGTRVVQIRQEEKVFLFDLDKVVKKVWESACSLSQEEDLSLKHRVLGLDVADKLVEFLTVPFEKPCFFTQFLLSIRHFISKINPKRSSDFFLEKTRAVFLAYDQNSFISQFSGRLEGNRRRGFRHAHLAYSIIYSNGSIEFYAREVSLRAAVSPEVI